MTATAKEFRIRRRVWAPGLPAEGRESTVRVHAVNAFGALRNMTRDLRQNTRATNWELVEVRRELSREDLRQIEAREWVRIHLD